MVVIIIYLQRSFVPFLLLSVAACLCWEEINLGSRQLKHIWRAHIISSLAVVSHSSYNTISNITTIFFILMSNPFYVNLTSQQYYTIVECWLPHNFTRNINRTLDTLRTLDAGWAITSPFLFKWLLMSLEMRPYRSQAVYLMFCILS